MYIESYSEDFGCFFFPQSALSEKLVVLKVESVHKKITLQYFSLKKTDLTPGCAGTFPNITRYSFLHTVFPR